MSLTTKSQIIRLSLYLQQIQESVEDTRSAPVPLTVCYLRINLLLQLILGRGLHRKVSALGSPHTVNVPHRQ